MRKDTKEKIIASGKYPDVTIGKYRYYYDLINGGWDAVIMQEDKYGNKYIVANCLEDGSIDFID